MLGELATHFEIDMIVRMTMSYLADILSIRANLGERILTSVLCGDCN